MNKWIVAAAIVSALAVAGLWWPQPQVSSFEECVAAGNPVLPVVPGQCQHGGKVFTDELAPPP